MIDSVNDEEMPSLCPITVEQREKREVTISQRKPVLSRSGSAPKLLVSSSKLASSSPRMMQRAQKSSRRSSSLSKRQSRSKPRSDEERAREKERGSRSAHPRTVGDQPRSKSRSRRPTSQAEGSKREKRSSDRHASSSRDHKERERRSSHRRSKSKSRRSSSHRRMPVESSEAKRPESERPITRDSPTSVREIEAIDDGAPPQTKGPSRRRNSDAALLLKRMDAKPSSPTMRRRSGSCRDLTKRLGSTGATARRSSNNDMSKLLKSLNTKNFELEASRFNRRSSTRKSNSNQNLLRNESSQRTDRKSVV